MWERWQERDWGGERAILIDGYILKPIHVSKSLRIPSILWLSSFPEDERTAWKVWQAGRGKGRPSQAIHRVSLWLLQIIALVQQGFCFRCTTVKELLRSNFSCRSLGLTQIFFFLISCWHREGVGREDTPMWQIRPQSSSCNGLAMGRVKFVLV